MTYLSDDKCINCGGILGDLSPGREPDELCETCYHDTVVAMNSAKPVKKSVGEELADLINYFVEMEPTEAMSPNSNDILNRIRDAGWSVAVHNDYRLGGESYTFWLFTHPSGRWAKGEGRTDAEALSIVNDIIENEKLQAQRVRLSIIDEVMVALEAFFDDGISVDGMLYREELKGHLINLKGNGTL